MHLLCQSLIKLLKTKGYGLWVLKQKNKTGFLKRDDNEGAVLLTKDSDLREIRGIRGGHPWPGFRQSFHDLFVAAACPCAITAVICIGLIDEFL